MRLWEGYYHTSILTEEGDLYELGSISSTNNLTELTKYTQLPSKIKLFDEANYANAWAVCEDNTIWFKGYSGE